MNSTALVIVTFAIIIAIVAYSRFRHTDRPVPTKLRPGSALPDFQALDENGNAVRSTQLRGTATVMLFVRGNWCPFCSSQVEDLAVHYKDIIDMGARLILVTPRPLETTRRVASFFAVEFEFWLDDDLSITRQLGLLHESGVPKDHFGEYGQDTIWPTAVVIDRHGIIHYTKLSESVADRPDPETLLRELRVAKDI